MVAAATRLVGTTRIELAEILHQEITNTLTVRVLGYTDYRNFEAVIEKARTACFNSGQRVDDHFVEVTEMVGIGSGAQRSVKTVMMSRYPYTFARRGNV